MPKRILNPEQALGAALAALDTLKPDERVVDVSFGTFSDHTDMPGGAYYSLRVVREVGNTQASTHTYESFRERDLQDLIGKWRRKFYPTPEEIERAQGDNDGPRDRMGEDA